jgi:oxalate decarboxylase/phosphoglucose isomerase-like protein (cupin superfamily)
MAEDTGGEAFDLDRLRADQAAAGEPYLEFLRREALSAGLYVLDVGEPDQQQPHAEDEVYVVISGRATLTVGDDDHPLGPSGPSHTGAVRRFVLGPGSVVYVARHVPHRFHDITERLSVLVFFAPAETG